MTSVPRDRLSLPAARRVALAAQGFGRTRPAGEPGTRAIADVVRRMRWPLANDLAVACVPKDWWDHCWTVAYRLVKEGLADVPQVPGWLRQSPRRL